MINCLLHFYGHSRLGIPMLPKSSALLQSNGTDIYILAASGHRTKGEMADAKNIAYSLPLSAIQTVEVGNARDTFGAITQHGSLRIGKGQWGSSSIDTPSENWSAIYFKTQRGLFLIGVSNAAHASLHAATQNVWEFLDAARALAVPPSSPSAPAADGFDL